MVNRHVKKGLVPLVLAAALGQAACVDDQTYSSNPNNPFDNVYLAQDEALTDLSLNFSVRDGTEGPEMFAVPFGNGYSTHLVEDFNRPDDAAAGNLDVGVQALDYNLFPSSSGGRFNLFPTVAAAEQVYGEIDPTIQLDQDLVCDPAYSDETVPERLLRHVDEDSRAYLMVPVPDISKIASGEDDPIYVRFLQAGPSLDDSGATGLRRGQWPDVMYSGNVLSINDLCPDRRVRQ